MIWFGNKKKSQRKLTDPVESQVLKDDNVKTQNNFFKTIIAVLAIGLICIYVKLSEMDHNQRVTITPIGTTEQYQIFNDSASKNYIFSMMTDIVSLYFNVNESNVDAQTNALLTLVHPTQYTRLREGLKKRAEVIKKLHSSTFFGAVDYSKPIKIAVLSSKEKSDFGYKLKKVYQASAMVIRDVIVGTSVAKTKELKYLIDYTIIDGHFYWLDIHEVKK